MEFINFNAESEDGSIKKQFELSKPLIEWLNAFLTECDDEIGINEILITGLMLLDGDNNGN